MRGPKVKDVMTQLVVRLYPKDSIRDAAMHLARNNISGAPVVKNRTIVGIVTEADLVRAAIPSEPDRGKPTILGIVPAWRRAATTVEDSTTVVEDVMTHSVVSISPDATVWDAAALMERHGVKRLPVADVQNKLVGIISRADVVRMMARGDDEIRADVLASIRSLGEECTAGIRVQVENGAVTLRGRADRRSTQEISIRLAAGIAGVTNVVDRLSYELDDGGTKPPTLTRDRSVVGPLVRPV